MGDVYLNIEARITKIQEGMKDLQNSMTALQKKSEETNVVMREEFNATGKVTSQLTGMLTGLFSVGAVTAFIKKIIDLRSEWEKQTAVLRTLTGSQKEAESTMKMIKKVADASLSPLKEVSDAYIRLVNQGIKPTFSEMKKMVDVAVASGRSFGQLAEAIFDATNGQIRGLKDFGIQSKIMGDKVKLSFRGMTESVDMTGEAIADFVIKAGEMNGVMGASERVGKTLVGTFDDLGDEVETILLTLGKFSEGNIVESVGILTNLLSIVNSTIELTSSDKAKKSNEFYKNIALSIGSLIPVIGDVIKSKQGMDLLSKFLDLSADRLKEIVDLKSEENVLEIIFGKPGEIIEYGDLIKKLVADMAKGLPDISIGEIANIQTIDEITKLQKRIKEMIGTLSGPELAEANQQLYWLGVRLGELGELGVETPDIVEKKVESIKGLVESLNDLRVPDATVLKDMGDAEVEIFKSTQDEKIEIAQEALGRAIEFVDTLAQYQNAKMNQELAKAEDNAAKQDEIRRKYARKEQTLSIARAVISGAEGILKTGANLGYPLAIPFQVLQAIETAIQIAAIKAQKFATGGWVGGKPHSQGGTMINAERDEFIVKAKSAQKYANLLEAINKDKLPIIRMELMDDFSKLQGITNNLNYDNSKEIRELRNVQKLLKDLQGSETIQGKYKVIKRGGITTKISLN